MEIMCPVTWFVRSAGHRDEPQPRNPARAQGRGIEHTEGWLGDRTTTAAAWMPWLKGRDAKVTASCCTLL